jgi:hypothetical protein
MQYLKLASLSVLIAIVPLQAHAADSAKPPSKMSPKEIAEHNEGLDQSDPAYIKCRRLEEIGSLAGKKRVCRSNAQWAASADATNRETREMIEGMARSGGTNGN